MSYKSVQVVLENVKSWPRAQRVELARRLNRLTALERLEEIAINVQHRSSKSPLSDRIIDDIVKQVRRKRPLHRR